MKQHYRVSTLTPLFEDDPGSYPLFDSRPGLDKLNYLYEQRFPTLRFVTYVAGRSRAQVADELEALLGPNIAGLAPSDAHLDPNDVHSSSASFTFPAEQVIAAETPLWEAELHRGEDALWEIAGDRAGKLVRRIEAGEDVQAHVPASTAAPVAPTAFDVPFLSLPTFRALILSSPLLHTFLESDLPQSFILEPPARQTSTKDAFLSAFNDAANAAQGVGTSTGKPVITRERFKGLFGGLIGEVANRVGQQTISGPKPSFSSRAGGRTLSLEEAAGRGSKLAPVSPAALGGRKPSIAALQVESKEAAKGEKQVQDATEALRLAQEALLQRDTNQFVIDAPGEETADAPGESVEDLDIDLDAEEGSATQSRVTGKEAQIAKGEYTATCVLMTTSADDFSANSPRLANRRSALNCRATRKHCLYPYPINHIRLIS